MAKRLFDALDNEYGRKQVVLSGEVEDYFMVDMAHGLKTLRQALEIFATRNGFEVVVILNESAKLEFLSPVMSRLFDEAVKKISVDPLAGDRNQKQFNPGIPRRSASGPPGGSDTSPNSQAQEAAQQVAGNASSAEQNTLDQIKRLLDSPRKCLVVFFNPERIWAGNPQTCDLRKLETVIGWCKHEGNSDSFSILVVNPNRLEEFNGFADRWGNRKQFTSTIRLGKADRDEFSQFLRRVRCRHGLACEPGLLFDAAAAKNDLNLYNFSCLVRDFMRENPEAISLEKLFTEEELSVSLDRNLAQLNQMVGLAKVKKMVQQLVTMAKNDVERRRLGQKVGSVSYHMVLLGNPGTGKTEVARLISRIFWAVGLRSSREFVETDPTKIISAYNTGDTRKNMNDAITKALGGTLFIDEVYGLAESSFGGKDALETLLKRMEDHRENLTVIVAGYREKLPKLYDINPGLKDRFKIEIDFPDYSLDELVAIYQLMVEKAGLTIGAAALEKVRAYLDTVRKFADFGNARSVRNEFESALNALRAQSSDSMEILPSMVSEPVTFNRQEAQRVLERLKSDFKGLQKVKDHFENLFKAQLARHLMGQSGTNGSSNHCFFVGNPGTGKTSVARLLGDFLYYLGLVQKKGSLIEKKPSDFSPEGQKDGAAKVLEAFKEAQGGVLFIDEAHSLQDSGAISQLMSLLTDPKRNNLVLILAGYRDQMQNLINRDEGFKSRMREPVVFEDLELDDLVQVFHERMKSVSAKVEPGKEEIFEKSLRKKLASMKRARNFGNARDVGKLFETAQNNALPRIADSNLKEMLLLPDDLSQDQKHQGIKEILQEMDRDFVGLDSVKSQIRRLALDVEMTRKREEASKGHGGSGVPLYHMRFVGPPGTGKTTVARIMGRVFQSLGIISRSEVREIRGIDLKGSYVGQTKDKVNNLFQNSEGQVVLIDEVYGLKPSNRTENDSFAQEAIDSLVGCITDSRNQSTVLVIAGYKEATDEFLATNDGLRSRFPHEIIFPDYKPEECVEILHRLMEKEKFTWPKDNPSFDKLTLELFTHMAAAPHFGNARTVGGVFGEIKANLNHRLHEKDSYDNEELFAIHLQDLEKVALGVGLGKV